MLKVKKTRKQD